MKPLLVITHERSGTHLLINLINYNKNGEFLTIGVIPNGIPHTLENYKFHVYKSLVIRSYIDDCVCKSHHQVEFMEEHLDFIFEKYNVIYLKRDFKDVIISYYNFIEFSDKKLPNFEDWIFMKPDDIGKKYLHTDSTDPHVIIEPNNYIDRWKIHIDGWMKYKDNLLVLNYEDILNDYQNEKLKIENYIGRKIADTIPDVNDKNLPNFNPGKGIVGGYKNVMSDELIKKINKF